MNENYRVLLTIHYWWSEHNHSQVIKIDIYVYNSMYVQSSPEAVPRW